MNKGQLTESVKKKAAELGFLSCGISKAAFLEEEAVHLEKWLDKGYQAGMKYMENHFDKRLDPRLLVDDAKSVISVLINYYPEAPIFEKNGLKISKYAYGEDYHLVLKRKLSQLLEYIQLLVGEVNARCFTDSAPVLDKAWAERSGLGWIGKNANLISRRTGSFFFIGEIILDVVFDYDQKATDHCGSCTKCIDACPTDAIVKPQLIDAGKCISYLTIELRDQFISSAFEGKMEDWVFGCDICQDVCPWNRFSTPTAVSEFKPSNELSNLDLLELTEKSFNTIFKNSAVKRAKYTGLMRNVGFVNKKGER